MKKWKLLQHLSISQSQIQIHKFKSKILGTFQKKYTIYTLQCVVIFSRESLTHDILYIYYIFICIVDKSGKNSQRVS